MEGYLKKWVNLIYQWQPRYFILHEDSLIYCQKKGGPKKGQVHLSICSIRAVAQDPLRIVINYGMSEMHLRASNSQEKQQWLDALLMAQQQIDSRRSKNLLQQKKRNPFEFLDGAPMLDLKRIHSSLTKIWVVQAKLEEQLSFAQSQQQIGQLANEVKQLATTCAQQMDEEYNKLLVITQKLQEKIRESNDMVPPDHEDLDDELLTEQYFSFKDEDFQSINQELYDERVTTRRPSLIKRMETTPNAKPVSQILETIKVTQPIKYKNMSGSEAFKMMSLGGEETRQVLPVLKEPTDLKIFSLIRDMVGRDLTKIAFPVTFNEPLSMLQNLCENLEYSELLDQANKFPASTDRLAYVMVFSISSLSATINRLRKPFNPILGETYEFQNQKFRYIAEQVSHHPPVSVGFAENQNFEFLADSQVETSFWGKSLEVTPKGWINVHLKKHGDQITFQRCKSAVKNLIIGTQYLDHFGEMKFVNTTTGDSGLLKLTERGWNGSGAYQVNGWVKNKQGESSVIIQGKWDAHIELIVNGQSTRVWQRNPLPNQYEQQYCFTQFAIQLNHLNKQLLKQLPPTDSRLRPDQRALENGNVDLAAIEKTRLEQKQRAARKQGHQGPRWFCQENGQYVFKKEYWQMRDTLDFHTQNGDLF